MDSKGLKWNVVFNIIDNNEGLVRVASITEDATHGMLVRSCVDTDDTKGYLLHLTSEIAKKLEQGELKKSC